MSCVATGSLLNRLLPGQDERAFISLVDERTYHLLDTGEPLEREKV
jgi:hypothetical protein